MKLNPLSPRRTRQIKTALKLGAAVGILLLVIGGAVLAFVAGNNADADSTTVDVNGEIVGDVERFTDNETNVTCYVYEGTTGGGISCLPNDEIDTPG